MNMSSSTQGSPSIEKRLPPVEQISVAVLILVITSGIYVASHLPNPVSLTPSTVLVTLAALLVLLNVLLLSKIPNFAWKTFFQVAKWTLLAYVVIAGMLEYIFIFDGTRGSVLVLLSSTLVIFAVNLPILFGFTVAKFQD